MGWLMWPLEPVLDTISAILVAYGGWVTVSALLHRRPRDFAQLASRVSSSFESGFAFGYEFDETDACRHVRESVNAAMGARFLFVGAAGTILARVLPNAGLLGVWWLLAALAIAGCSLVVAERWRRRQISRLVSQSFLAWLESLTSDPTQPVQLGKTPVTVFVLAWDYAIDALKVVVQREVGADWTPTTERDYRIVAKAVCTLSRECGWKPDEPAWRAWLRQGICHERTSITTRH